MEIGASNVAETSGGYVTTKNSDNIQGQKGTEPDKSKVISQQADNPQQERELSKEELKNVNSQLNKFMSSINADIQFEMHDRTKQLMVQVVNTQNNRVLREFPSHEMLDVLANISDYIGILLDKKA